MLSNRIHPRHWLSWHTTTTGHLLSELPSVRPTGIPPPRHLTLPAEAFQPRESQGQESQGGRGGVEKSPDQTAGDPCEKLFSEMRASRPEKRPGHPLRGCGGGVCIKPDSTPRPGLSTPLSAGGVEKAHARCSCRLPGQPQAALGSGSAPKWAALAFTGHLERNLQTST